MDKNKKPQALDDEALDRVSGGIQFTTLIVHFLILGRT